MKRSLKITYVTPVLFGQTLFAHARINLARAFIDRGFEFQFIAPNTPKASEILSQKGISHRLYDWLEFPGVSTFSKSRGAVRELRNSITEYIPDIIISELRITSRKMSSLIGSMRGKKIVWMIDDRSPPVMEGLLGKLQLSHYDFLVPKIVSNASGIIVQNSQHQDFMKNRFNCHFPDFINCGGGVDVGRFSPEGKQFEASEPVIVYAGSLVRERGILDLFEACKHAIDNDFKLKLITMGKGPLSPELEAMSSEFDWLEHKGLVTDQEYCDSLNVADIGVVPHPDKLAWRICSPLKMKEYAASGLVVIATDLPSHRDLGERDWLRLIDPGNFVSEFYNTIKEIAESRSISELSESAIRDSVDFSWNKETEEIHNWIMSKVRI